MASRHGHSKSDDPSFAVIANITGASSSRLPPPPAPLSPSSPTSSMAFVGNRPVSVPHPPHSPLPASSARQDAFTSMLSRHPFPESDSMSHVQFSINGGRDRGGPLGGGGGNGISSEEARWIEANMQRDTLKRWRTWQKCLGAVSALWATYTATRYFVAFVLYADDHDRQVYALTLGTLSACSLFIYGANAMYAWFGHSPRSLIALFRCSTYAAALTLVTPAIVNVVLTCIWNDATAQGSPHNVSGRCNWDLDVVWTGTSGECSASGHDPISFAAWLTGAIIRLVITLLILGGFQYTSHVIYELSGGFCPLAAMIHRSRSHSIVPLVGGPGSHRDSESTMHHSSQQHHHPNTSVDTVRPNPPLSPPLPPLASLPSSSSSKTSTPTRREPRVLLRHDRPPGLGPLPAQPHSPHQQQQQPPLPPPVMATVITPPGPLVTPPLSRNIPTLGTGPRYPDPDFGSDSSNPSSPADIYYSPGGAYGGRYATSTPGSNGATPTPPATTTRNSSRRSTATSTATSSTAASGTGTGSGSGGHYYSQPNPNGGSYFPPQPQQQQQQQQRPQSPPGLSPTRAQMQEYQFPYPSTSAASSPLSPSTPGSSADYAMLQTWATDFRSMIDRVNRETEEGLEMARETGSYANPNYYDQGRSNGYGNISQSGPSSVMVVGGVVRRMETIESFGSKEVQSIMGNSRPPTALGMASASKPNRTSRGLSVDSTATNGRGPGEREKESP